MGPLSAHVQRPRVDRRDYPFAQELPKLPVQDGSAGARAASWREYTILWCDALSLCAEETLNGVVDFVWGPPAVFFGVLCREGAVGVERVEFGPGLRDSLREASAELGAELRVGHCPVAPATQRQCISLCAFRS